MFAVRATITFVVAWAVAFFLTNVFQTWPIAANWDPNVEASHSINMLLMTIFLQITDVLTDFVILCLPWFFIWGLRMDSRDRLALTGVFILGAL